MTDRESLVRRHAIEITRPDPSPANGGLLAAVSLMAAGWDSTDAGTDCPGFPRDGGWQVRHEGFTVWP
ncbi:hypothetical protein ACWD25_21225 [Streptomyces sp. NPDC002920]